jgi:hypothetical protein
VDESVAYAEVWRAVYEDARKARVRRSLARRTAWRTVAEASGGVWAELPRTAEVAAVDVVQRSDVPVVGPANRAVLNGSPAPRSAPPPVNGNGSAPPPADGSPPARRDGSPRRVLAVVGPDESGGLGARVQSFLDSHVNPADYARLDDADDAYLLWTTARALHTDIEEIADDVRDWRRRRTAQVHRSPVEHSLA